MPDPESTRLDERVSNIAPIESGEEQPETPDASGAAEPDGEVGAVEGYELPEPPAAPEIVFAPEAAP